MAEETAAILIKTRLNEQQQLQILMAKGLTMEEAKVALATASTSAANVAAAGTTGIFTGATLSLKTAFKGLWATLIANPITLIITAIATAIALFSIIKNQIEQAKQEAAQAAEEAKQATLKAASAAVTLSDEISSLTQKYIELSEAVKTDEGAKTSLLSTQDDLIKKLGIEQTEIDKLIEKYGSLSEAIKAAAVDKLQEAERDIRGGINTYKSALLDAAEVQYENGVMGTSARMPLSNLVSIWGTVSEKIKEGTDEYKAIAALDNSDMFRASGTNKAFTFGINGMVLDDLESVEGIKEAYTKLGQALDIVANSAGSDNDIYKKLYEQYNKVSEALENYDSSFDSLNGNLSQQYVLMGLIGRELPKTQSEFDSYRDSVINSAISSGDFVGTTDDIKNSINSVLKEQTQFKKFYNNTGEALDTLSIELTNFKAKINALKSAQDEYNKNGFVSSATYKQLQEYANIFDFSSGKIEIVSDKVNDLVDDLIEEYGATLAVNGATSDQIANMVNLAKSLETVAEKAEDAFDAIKDLAGILEDAASGTSMTAIETWELIADYPELANAITKTTNGYKLEAEAVKELIKLKAQNLQLSTSAERQAARTAFVANTNNENSANNVDKIFAEYYNQNGKNISSFDEYEKAWEKYFNSSSEGANWIDGLQEYVESIINDNQTNDLYSSLINDFSNPDTLVSPETKKKGLEVEWNKFDARQEMNQSVVDESNYLLDLMNSKDLFDDKGKITSYGNASLGLHGVNYQIYLKQAQQYADEIAKIEKQISDDPSNKDLIDRKEELLKLQRESVLASEDEKQAMIDLIKEGIDAQLDSLQKLIDKYEDSLSAAKDLYDYQNKVSDATEEIGKLQKQLIAYENDDSEETKAQIQQLKTDLQKAQEELQETEYDQFIGDQKKLLDDIYTSYETSLNKKLDDTDSLITDLLTSVDTNAANIKTTLTETSAEFGTSLSSTMSGIWDAEGSAGKVVSNGFTTIDNALQNIIKIADNLKLDDGNDEETVVPETTVTIPETASITIYKDPETKNTQTTQTQSPKQNDTSGRWTSYEDAASDGYSNIRTPHEFLRGGDDKTKYGTYQAYLDAMHQKYMPAYAQGGLVDSTGVAWLDGTKSKPEMVLSPEDTQNFLELRDMLARLASSSITMANNGYGFSVPSIQHNIANIGDRLKRLFENVFNNSSNIENKIEMSINIDHVQDYNDFITQLQHDSKFEKLIEIMTAGKMLGKSSVSKYNLKWD